MSALRNVLFLWLGILSGSLASGQSLIVRSNAGGPTLTDDLGQVWSADQPYSAGSNDGYLGGSTLPLLSPLGATVVGGQENPLKR